MICRATADVHCCYILGMGVCPHFDSTRTDGFCSLRADLPDWEAVHRDPRYRPQRDALEKHGSVLCGDWPARDEKCNACGVTG